MKSNFQIRKIKRKKKIHLLKQTKVNHPRHRFQDEYDAAREWCESQPMRDMYIRSNDNLKLHASFLPAENAKRYVVMCHGYRGTRFGSSAHIAKFLHENKCSLLLIDQRCCGESEGRIITYGAKEQYDIINWLKLIDKINVRRLPVYLYGQSMGATSILLASGHKLPGNVHGLIADCGFHSMKEELQDILKNWFHIHLFNPIIRRIDFRNRVFGGFSLNDTDTTEALKRNTHPILFFHGEEDTYVWPANTIKNYQICRAPKEMVIIPNAKHLCSSFEAPELYNSKIISFFNRYDDLSNTL